jgi:methylthioribose-1-phosphate isomerase
MATAIKNMQIRGAPAIGVAAAFGIALGALEIETVSREEFLSHLDKVTEAITSTRPTARNLFRAAERMTQVALVSRSVPIIKKRLVNEAIVIHQAEEKATAEISRLGASLINTGDTVLTHCNTGPLATAGYGTALGVIIEAYRQGKIIHVLVDETRPRLQGARLTTWELKTAGVPFRLITDSMAGHFMQQGIVNCCVVGADRIARNGDTANKIGTYTLAVLADAHQIPFYVAAPFTTFDRNIADGEEIPIEERCADEVTRIDGKSIAPEGIEVCNPAFDITPHRFITAIIIEKGIIREPFVEGIKGIQ